MTVHITISNALRIEADTANVRRLEGIKWELTIPNPAQVSAAKYGRSTWGIPPVLTFYRQGDGGLIIPRGFGWKLTAMADMRDAVWIDNRRLCPSVPFTFCGQLRPYQEQALAHVLELSQGVLQAGTGAGKTVMALAIIAARKQPALVLVHNKELLHQWAERAGQFLGVEAGRIGDGRCEVQPLTVGIVNSVRTRVNELTPYFGHVVVDECHRCPSTMFTECVDAFDAHYRLGLSATPFRRDGLTKVIHFFLGPKVHEVDPDHLRQVGAILRPEVVTRQTGFRFHGDGSDQYQELLAALTQDPARNELIARDVHEDLARNDGTALVVSDRVAHLESLRLCLEAGGVKMELLTGKTPKARREAVVKRVLAGEVQVLGSTVQLIGEGFDCPGLSSLFLATPIKFSGRLLQVVGRILRPQADKVPVLFDYVDPVGVLKASASARAQIYDRQGFITEHRPGGHA